MDEVFKTVHNGKKLINTGFMKMCINSCAQKSEKFSTGYPQIVENLRKLKIRWIVWIKFQGKYVDNVNEQNVQARNVLYRWKEYAGNKGFFK